MQSNESTGKGKHSSWPAHCLKVTVVFIFGSAVNESLHKKCLDGYSLYFKITCLLATKVETVTLTFCCFYFDQIFNLRQATKSYYLHQRSTALVLPDIRAAFYLVHRTALSLCLLKNSLPKKSAPHFEGHVFQSRKSWGIRRTLASCCLQFKKYCTLRSLCHI